MMVELADRNLSGQYQHNIARSLKAFLNFCVREELLDLSPFDRLKMPKLPQHEIEFFNPTEITKILKACKTERDLALCTFLLDTGLRASEAIAVNIGDLDRREGTVNVVQGKGQKDRTVYIGAKTRRHLARYLRTRPDAVDREPLFVSQSKERLTLDGLVQLMRRLQERSGVPKCRAHTFRRTFAVNCLRNGMNVYVVAKLMGHADITMLKRYLAFLEQDLAAAHARHGVVDNL
jgi:integrase/recombinase XerD